MAEKALPKPHFILSRLNVLRRICLTLIFFALIFLPFLSVYQSYVASHAYDLLLPEQKLLYDSMETITSPLLSNPEEQLGLVKGNTWSLTIANVQFSDPLAVVGQTVALGKAYWPFVLTAFIPVLLTVIFGRFYCGWVCPATFLYELNSNLSVLLEKWGVPIGHYRLSRQLKYWVLALGLIVSMIYGAVLVAAIYPPAIIGRELFYVISLGGFGSGITFFLMTMLFDLLITRRGFCRYLCPGGALYSLLGRYRLLRIQRKVTSCNNCSKCVAVCEFGLNPLKDDFGQECNNCTACIAVCPTDALVFTVNPKDQPPQGVGHLGRNNRIKVSNSE